MDCTQVKFKALQTGVLSKAKYTSELWFETLLGLICAVSAASEE